MTHAEKRPFDDARPAAQACAVQSLRLTRRRTRCQRASVRARFGTRLVVSIDIEPASLRARVPALILQPLVENAVKHCIALRPEGGRVSVSTSAQNGRLELIVENEGLGTANGETSESGLGIAHSNLQARLRLLYGDDFAFRSEQLNVDSHRVQITIPHSTET